LGRLEVEVVGGRFTFAVPEAHMEENEQENESGFAGLANPRCPLVDFMDELTALPILFAVISLYYMIHRPGMLDRPRAVRGGLAPLQHEETALPCQLQASIRCTRCDHPTH
jgi:hypothetical protein